MRRIDEHARFSLLDLAWLMPANIVADLGAALRRGVIFKEFGSIVKFRFNQLVGTYQGYNDPPEASARLRARFYYPTRPHEQRLVEDEHSRHRIDYEALKAQKAGGARIVRISGEKK